MSDRIRLWIVNDETGEELEDLGYCLVSNPSRAAEMYQDDAAKWEEKGYSASIAWEWEDVTKRAAAALGRSKSPAKTAAARENGKLGGWPKGKARKPQTE